PSAHPLAPLLSLHDALPIYRDDCRARQAWLSRLRPAHEQPRVGRARTRQERWRTAPPANAAGAQEAVRDLGRPHPDERAQARERSEEHTSELQSLAYLVCRL